MSTAMTTQMSTLFDADVIRKCAEAGVPPDYLASCFLTTTEELIAEIKRVPELLLAFARGRAEHLCFLFTTLKNSTSPSLLALLARTEGFGSKPKAAKDSAEKDGDTPDKPRKARRGKAEPGDASEVELLNEAMALVAAEEGSGKGPQARAAQAISQAAKPAPVRKSKLAALVQGNSAPTQAAAVPDPAEPVELSNGQREALAILQQMQGKPLSRSQRRTIEREISKAEKKGQHSQAALLVQQASGVVLPG